VRRLNKWLIGAGAAGLALAVGVVVLPADDVQVRPSAVSAVSAGGQRVALKIVAAKVTPSLVYGGYSTRGAVQLSKPAPAGGAVLTLTGGAGVKLPKTVKVKARSRVVSFAIGTSKVRKKTGRVVKVAYKGQTVSLRFTVYQLPVINAFKLASARVVGGGVVQGTVRLNGPGQPGGTKVALASRSTLATVRSRITVSESYRSTTFQVRTKKVTAAKTVTILAKHGAKLWSAKLRIVPATANGAKVTGLTINPGKVGATTATTATVTLDRVAPAGGTEVTFSSDSDSVIPAATKLTIPAGQQTGNLQLNTRDNRAAQVTAHVTAAANGATATAALIVDPAPIKMLDFHFWPYFPQSFTAGETVWGEIWLNHDATEKLTIKITRDDGVQEADRTIYPQSNGDKWAWIAPASAVNRTITFTATLGTQTIATKVNVGPAPPAN
jgi:hypothetical protein